jgi:restriction endonuclease S subunit
MSFNQGCKGILAKNIDYEFLYYLLNLSKIKLENLGSGNTFKEISTNNLKEMKVSFPKDQKEQQKIASCLSSLDSLIEAQNKRIYIFIVTHFSRSYPINFSIPIFWLYSFRSATIKIDKNMLRWEDDE